MMSVNSEIKYSANESRRFGYKIFRGEMDVLDAGYIESLIADQKPDIIILRLPVEQKTFVNRLCQTGIQVLHCDTILYYEYDLTMAEPPLLKNNLVFHTVTASSQDIVDGLIAETFLNYQNHYDANPVLSKTQITEGYKEWAKTFIQDSNRFSWYVTLNGDL
jgi:hypothetical protein